MAKPVDNICDLPPEMQEEILSKLEDANDSHSVINTCPLWHDIMEHRKAEMLFAQILPILLEEEPYPLNNMLVLRQVCKEWKRETDRALVLNHDKFDREPYHLLQADQIQRFLTHASTLPDGVNPILGNCITLSINNFDNVDPRVQLIHRYGTYIRTIKMEVLIQNYPLNELQSVMSSMPNLECLILTTYVQNWIVGDEAPALPPLPLLKRLCIHTENRNRFRKPNHTLIQEFFISFVRAYGQQLESILCSQLLLRIESISDQLPNLTSLEIEECPAATATGEDLHTLSQVHWQLERLQIHTVAPSTIHFSTALVEMLNKFSRTLTSLDLFLELEHNFDPSHLAEFPCLEMVNLRVSSTFDVFQEEMVDRLNSFSVVCPNLKKLEITTEGMNMIAAVGEQLQFAQMKVVFQQLQKFTHTYSRPRLFLGHVYGYILPDVV